MKKTLAAILLGSFALSCSPRTPTTTAVSPPATESSSSQESSGQPPAIKQETAKQNRLQHFEEDMKTRGYFVYSQTTPAEEAALILIGKKGFMEKNDKRNVQPSGALVGYVEEQDLVLVGGYPSGMDLRNERSAIPLLEGLERGRIIGLDNPELLKRYEAKWKELFDLVDDHTALSTVMSIETAHEIDTLDAKIRDAYVAAARENAKEENRRTYLLVDDHHITDGDLTIQLKQEGIRYVALAPRVERIMKWMEGTVTYLWYYTVKGPKGKVKAVYGCFGHNGVPYSFVEADDVEVGSMVGVVCDDYDKEGLQKGEKYKVLKISKVKAYE